MANSMQWTWTGRFIGEPAVTITATQAMDAHERATIPLPAGADGLLFTIAPGATILAIASSSYTDAADPSLGITLKVNDTGDPLTLSMPLLLAGTAVLKRFVGADPLATISFSSTLTRDAVLEILTVRDATPNP